jgi:colanic acid biosynthesis protein WcaH
MKLPAGHFLSTIESTPLVSVDLVIVDPRGRVLLGRRTNKPAQGFWFVPGGRIRKNERIEAAFARLTESELGRALPFAQAALLGAYDHIYEDNVFGLDSINTHYVVLAYRCRLESDQEFHFDGQHDELRWWAVAELLKSDEVHQNTKNYFKSHG